MRWICMRICFVVWSSVVGDEDERGPHCHRSRRPHPPPAFALLVLPNPMPVSRSAHTALFPPSHYGLLPSGDCSYIYGCIHIPNNLFTSIPSAPHLPECPAHPRTSAPPTTYHQEQARQGFPLPFPTPWCILKGSAPGRPRLVHCQLQPCSFRCL